MTRRSKALPKPPEHTKTPRDPCSYKCSKEAGCRVFCRKGLSKATSTGKCREFGLSMCRECLEFLRSALDTGREIGGVLSMDLKGKKLHVGTVRKWGESANVDIPHGIVEYHTHPGHCTGPAGSECSLDMPSSTDIGVIVPDVLDGNVAHLVVAKTGTYVMSVGKGLATRLWGASKAERKRIARDIVRDFERLQNEFEDDWNGGRTTLARFRPQWIARAKHHGLNARFYPGKSTPSIRVCINTPP